MIIATNIRFPFSRVFSSTTQTPFIKHSANKVLFVLARALLPSAMNSNKLANVSDKFVRAQAHVHISQEICIHNIKDKTIPSNVARVYVVGVESHWELLSVCLMNWPATFRCFCPET